MTAGRAAALPLRDEAAATVIAPTRRVAYALRREHEAAQIAAGHGAWPTPDILAFDDLIERMHALDRQQGRSGLRRIPDSLALALWQSIIDADRELESLVFPRQLAPLAARAWRRLHAWGEGPGRPLHAQLASGRDESSETAAFARWALAYERALAERGWVDATQAPDRVSAQAAPGRVRLQGFERLTPQQQRWVGRLVTAGVEVAAPEVRAATADVRVVAADDSTQEFEHAVRWAAARLVENPHERLAIVSPELEPHPQHARRVLDRVFDPAAGRSGGPEPGTRNYQLALSESLGAEPLIVAAFELLDPWIEMPALVATGRFLRCAALAGAEEEADARALLDARLRRRAPLDYGVRALPADPAASDCPILRERIARAGLLVDAWSHECLASHWADRFTLLLSALGWAPPAGDGRALLAIEHWREALVELGSIDEVAGPLDARRALGRLRDLVNSAAFQGQSPPAALTVAGRGAVAALRFDAIWVCGLDAARWPGPARPDPLLPRAWQAQVQLPGSSAALAERDARDQLAALRASAAELVLSWPRAEGDAVLLPSPLLSGLPAAAIDLPLWPALDDARSQCVTHPSLERLLDSGLPPLAQGTRPRGGARLLELQSNCAFRAQAELRLGALPLEIVTQGIDPTERGTFVHAALARLWGELRNQERLLALDAAARRDLIEQAIDGALRELAVGVRGVHAELLTIEARWLRQRIEALLEADASRSRFEVQHCEQRRELPIGPLLLELRIDRVDRLADGSLAVIDYKTGAATNPAHWSSERPELPQMPAYALACGAAGAVSAVAFGTLRTERTGYVGLARDEFVFAPLKPSFKPADSWAGLFEHWRERLTRLAEEHAGGTAQLAHVPARACRHCHLHALCRIDELNADAGDDGDIAEEAERD